VRRAEGAWGCGGGSGGGSRGGSGSGSGSGSGNNPNNGSFSKNDNNDGNRTDPVFALDASFGTPGAGAGSGSGSNSFQFMPGFINDYLNKSGDKGMNGPKSKNNENRMPKSSNGINPSKNSFTTPAAGMPSQGVIGRSASVGRGQSLNRQPSSNQRHTAPYATDDDYELEKGGSIWTHSPKGFFRGSNGNGQVRRGSGSGGRPENVEEGRRNGPESGFGAFGGDSPGRSGSNIFGFNRADSSGLGGGGSGAGGVGGKGTGNRSLNRVESNGSDIPFLADADLNRDGGAGGEEDPSEGVMRSAKATAARQRSGVGAADCLVW